MRHDGGSKALTAACPDGPIGAAQLAVQLSAGHHEFDVEKGVARELTEQTVLLLTLLYLLMLRVVSSHAHGADC